MAYDKTSLVAFLTKSMTMDCPSTTSDPAYSSLLKDGTLGEIIDMAVQAHNPAYTIDTLPQEEIYFVVMQAKIEIYYRLSTFSAPFYPIEAEGANLRKDYRFTHYLNLVQQVQKEYDSAYANFKHDQPIQVGTVLLEKDHYTKRGYDIAVVPQVKLIANATASDHVDLSWTPFNVSGGIFYNYLLYLDTVPIYDEFEDSISSTAKLVDTIRDIHKYKYRIKGLTPITDYQILVVSQDSNSLKGYSEIKVTTSA